MFTPMGAIPEDREDDLVTAALDRADYVVQGIVRETRGQHVRKPEHDFGAGEGDDETTGYTWPFIQRFQLKDRRNASALAVLGWVISLLFVEAGMALEPQDRSGRVGHDKLIDTSGRVEFTSRIFVLPTRSTS